MSGCSAGRCHRYVIKSKLVREVLAEFLGTTLLIFLGSCSTAVVTFSGDQIAGSVYGPLSWGLSLALALVVTGHVSGHFNPAVTVALAAAGQFSWKRVPPYLLAQYIGAFLAAALVYVNYKEALDLFAGDVRNISTAQIFATYPRSGISTITCFIDQVISTAVLLIVVSALVDEKNVSVPKYMSPMVMMVTLSCILYAFSYNCMAPLNPARDVGPRVFTALAGWGRDVFSYRSYNWFWVPIVGPHVGGILGTWLYFWTIGCHQPEEDSFDLRPTSGCTCPKHSSMTTLQSVNSAMKF